MTSDESGLKSLFGLEDKHLLLTGATSVMSVWIAKMMRMCGARVTLTDRMDENKMAESYAAFAQQKGDASIDVFDQCHAIGSVDIRNRKTEEVQEQGLEGVVSVNEMVEKAIEANGPIDILINIAGGQEPIPGAMLSPEIFQKTLSRILVGTWNIMHEVFLRSMRDHGGRILTVTADIDQGFPGMPGMGAARAGLLSMHRALAVEWAGLGITTCVIAPGPVDTPGLKRYPGAERMREVAIDSCLQKRLIDPKEIAWLFVTMASPLARSASGSNLVANCGDSLKPTFFHEFGKM